MLDLTPLPKPRTVVNTPAAPVPRPKPRTIIQLDDISSESHHNLDSFENQDNIPDILPIPPRSSSSSNDSKFDTLGRKNAFHIGKSMLDPSYSDTSSSSVNTNLSTIVQEDYLNIDNIEMFETKKSKSPKIKRISKEIHGVEINDLEQNKKYEEVLKRTSSSSVESNTNVLGAKNDGILSIPGFIIPNQEWVVGDFSDSDSPYPATPSDITSLPRSSITSFQTDLSLQSVPEMQNSQKTVDEIKQNEVNVDRLKNKAPNELINNENREELVKTELKPLDTPKDTPQTLVNSQQLQEKDSQTVTTRSELPNTTQTLTLNSCLEESSLSVEKPSHIPKETIQPQPEPSLTVEIPKESPEDPELDWQYTLPSPPTAFRDDSPTTFTDMTNYDTLTLKGLTNDSVVTTPELFEKTESSVSENESISSGKPQVLLASKYISLQNLEKRKSLVLERELTNLTQNDAKRNVLMEIEEVMQKKNSLSRSNSQSREKLMLSALDSTLPNFKITTYDQPKKKINIFEDDSIRSNVEPKSSVNTSKRNSISNDYYNTKTNDSSNESSVGSKRNNSFGSHENIYSPKNDNFVFKKPHTPKYKHHHSSVTNITNPNEPAVVARSESFTQKNGIWSRLNPVKRSKSHVSLERYQDEQRNCSEESEEGLHKSNSLFNVSGLQSLEVMRMILPKLGPSPPTSPEKLNPSYQSLPSQPMNPPHVEKTEKLETNQFQIRAPAPPALKKHEETEIKKYQYRGPPAINLSTWSERPKSNVSLKEDNDYKINYTKTSIPSINIKVESKDQVDSGKINIKINSEPIAHKTSNGNVIIKIGENETKQEKSSFYTRFLNQTQATGYRKPLGNINGDKPQRPHSIAFDSSCPDLSRVPIVRAVELKKPFKDGGKTVTQIIHDLPPEIIQNGDILGQQPNEDSSQTEPRAQTNQITQNRGILGHKRNETNQNHSKQNSGNEHTPNRELLGQKRFSNEDILSRNQSGDVHNNINIQNKMYSNNGTQNGDYRMKSSTLGAQNRHSIANDGFMGTNGIQNGNFVTKRNNFSPQYNQNGQNRHSIANDDFITKTNTQTLNNQNRNASVYLSSENLSKPDQNKPLSVFPKPITRGNSFAARLNNPRVTGFRMPSEVEKQNWISNKYGTLPSKSPEIIPFSQNQLKRTEVNKSESEKSVFETVTLRTTTPKVNIPPPPPAMPIVKAVTKKPVPRQRPIDIDPRDQLLDSIRNFGGKAGLKATK